MGTTCWRKGTECVRLSHSRFVYLFVLWLFWFCGVLLFGFVCLLFWCCFVCLFYELSHSLFLHTKVVEFFTCLSGKALNLRVDLGLVAL